MQVKQFEPSIALETAIFLNLNSDEYDYRTRLDAVELSIVIAASLANWIVGQRQSIGLYTNAEDPLDAEGRPPMLTAHKGRAHLMRMLDVLARVRSIKTQPLLGLLQAELPHLSWGTTVIVITGGMDEATFEQVFRARRAGLDVMLVLSGLVPEAGTIRQHAQQFDVPLYEFRRERDLDVWRR